MPWSTYGSMTAAGWMSFRRSSSNDPTLALIILTGYGNIATAVSAVKLGAVDYLAKPADANYVASALLAPEGRKPEPPQHPMSPNDVRWGHINQIYEACGCNVSETARRLNMHRRTLQRVLARALRVMKMSGQCG